MKLDAIDLKLLQLLQENAELQIGQLAAEVQLSTTPCWRRIQRLKEAGIIKKQVALLDPAQLNVGVTVFVMIRTNQHSKAWFDSFKATVEVIPEVVEFYRINGEMDYMLRVVVPDIAAYDAVYQRLTSGTQLFDVSSSFAMEELKFTTALPLSYTK